MSQILSDIIYLNVSIIDRPIVLRIQVVHIELCYGYEICEYVVV